MASFFDVLLQEYPSGLGVQNLLAAKLFGVDESRTVTGNGAAELIRALAFQVSGTVGVIQPSFNEYAESFARNPAVRVKEYVPDRFAYTPDDLVRFAQGCDVLVLINPDTPTGHYIPRNAALTLAGTLKAARKLLILDESFADFACADEEPTLFREEVLGAYPNLVVVKSLSKSYGIPGIRLGVAACGDLSLVEALRSRLSIWNINAYAEYFLQIIGKYQKEYRSACKRIMEERTRFREALIETGLFEVYPSQANYLFCRLINGMTAHAFAEGMLQEARIFIKDFTGKKGIPGDSFIRLAVRNREDNAIFIERVGLTFRFLSYTPPPPPPPIKLARSFLGGFTSRRLRGTTRSQGWKEKGRRLVRPRVI
ncbi:MAG: aminotransferase class I/II-fold pyridoxal phosphate-dependent enzyme [Spirochaetaceae bacterium]|jgi:histidinol-phosphate/aromatic aminotransferase/cobyric acid decarboxylase-like protein|nr:aminotransferase class I/II-fold pyridoxal phosphate-dependent enzyme [Spirochaetaceae bacterium]